MSVEPTTTVMVIVTACSALGTSVLAYLSARDKLRFDAEAELLRKSMEDCIHDRDDLQARLDEAESRADAQALEAARMSGDLRAMDRTITDLRGEVKGLRDLLYGKSK